MQEVTKLSHFKRRTKLQVSGTYLDLHWLKGERELCMMREQLQFVSVYVRMNLLNGIVLHLVDIFVLLICLN
jgi:hypothetical protein